MARILGLEALRTADADVLPYDYVTYARAISSYIDAAKRKAADDGLGSLDFGPAEAAAARFRPAARAYAIQSAPSGNLARLNPALRETETAFLAPSGLPNRPWYRHTIYAPGEYTGYAAVVVPGVNEAIDARNSVLAAQQLEVLSEALLAPQPPWKQPSEVFGPPCAHEFVPVWRPKSLLECFASTLRLSSSRRTICPLPPNGHALCYRVSDSPSSHSSGIVQTQAADSAGSVLCRIQVGLFRG